MSNVVEVQNKDDFVVLCGVKEGKVIVEISENTKITINKNAVSRDNTIEFNSLKK